MSTRYGVGADAGTIRIRFHAEGLGAIALAVWLEAGFRLDGAVTRSQHHNNLCINAMFDGGHQ